ncbi:YfiR family protein [Paracidovorax sp. MALMAid1276]|uniref:YfiR family protein n=1 Tax=Paracidovorax sp. MALMAid1276 TaxID=3411631 RepID=UPI003B99AAAE
MPAALRLRTTLSTVLCTPLIAILCAMGTAARASDAVGELDLKAAYIFNFIQFIEWPMPTAAPAGAWTICVSPFSPLKRALTALEGKPARNQQPIRVKLLETGALRECRIAVLHNSDVEPVLAALRSLPPDHGVLTVADELTFAGPEIMITLFQQDGRIAFGIRTEATARAGLTVSSRLLRLAKPGR